MSALVLTPAGRFLAGIFGWDPRPSIEQVIVYLGYVIPVTYLFLRASKGKAPAPAPTQTAPQPVPSALLCATPMLVMGRAGDRLVPPDAVLRTAAFHGTVPVMLDGAGHAMMLDIDWPAVADRIIGFAAAIAPGAQEVSAP